MRFLLILLILFGILYAQGCQGPCGCESPAGSTELNISVYDNFGPIPPSTEGRRIWIEYEKASLVREIIWDGWNKTNSSEEFYQYVVPSCVGDPVSLDYYIYLHSGNSSCREKYEELVTGGGPLADNLDWNGSVYTDECLSGYQFKLIRSYFETSIPLYLYPDRYSKYSRGEGSCAPALLLLGILGMAHFAKQ